MKPVTAGKPVNSGEPARRAAERAASERRLGDDRTHQFGKRHGQISLGEFKLCLDLAALGGIVQSLRL